MEVLNLSLPTTVYLPSALGSDFPLEYWLQNK